MKRINKLRICYLVLLSIAGLMLAVVFPKWTFADIIMPILIMLCCLAAGYVNRMIDEEEGMKKLILIVLVTVIVSCYSVEDPLKYKGCVVVEKTNEPPVNGNLCIKLSPEHRKQHNSDYIWIGVPRWELEKLNLGDTIK